MGVRDPRGVAQHLDEPVAWHGEIVCVAAVVRASGNAAGCPASVPDRCLLGGVECAARASARVADERLDRVERVVEALDERLDLDDQRSLDTGRQQTGRELGEEVEHRLVDVLERGRGQPGAHDRLGGGTGSLELFEPADDHARRLGHRQQRHQCGGDDRERPLATDDEGSQIRRVEVVEPRRRAVCEHDLEAEDVIRRDAVGQAVQTACVGRDVPADRRDPPGRRVGGVVQAMEARLGVERDVRQPGLDQCAAFLDVERPQARHAVERQHECARRWYRAGRERRSAAPCHDGHACCRGDPNRRLDVAPLLGIGEAGGRADERRPISRNRPQVARVRADALRSERRAQLLDPAHRLDA